MAGGEETQKIVWVWQDSRCQTGESYYRTEDGRVWKTCWSTAPITGVRYGTVEDGRMRPQPW